jgi:mannose-6-phosphate isomerase-like protein (cupin superfamily)
MFVRRYPARTALRRSDAPFVAERTSAGRWHDAAMSSLSAYPEPVYEGDGEVSASFRPDSTAHELGSPPGNRVDYLATGAATEGGFGLYRWHFGAHVSGPDPHFHKTISESFYILSGTVKIYDGTRWVDTSAGDFVHVPPGGVHGFRNESGEEASMLLLFTPGAPREEYFETLFAGGTKGMTEPELAAFYLRHDNYWL